MIETLGQTFCRECGKAIVLPVRQGPHIREFCNGTCRKRWQRKHQKPQQKAINATMDTMEARINELEQRNAELERAVDLANGLLEQLLDKKQAKQPLKHQYQERLTSKGEQLDWPALDIHYTVKAGRKEWRVFMINESNTLLIRAIIAAERIEEKRKSS